MAKFVIGDNGWERKEPDGSQRPATVEELRDYSDGVEAARQAARQRMTGRERARYDYLRTAPRAVRTLALRAWRGSTQRAPRRTAQSSGRPAARRTSSSPPQSSQDPGDEPEPPRRRQVDALTHDPLAAVWDALDRAGCQPRGAPHKWTARCPAHEDRSPSLSGGVGADGRALLYCHRGCESAAVVAALGLAWADCFPPGHRHARPIRGMARPQRRFADLVLQALRELHIPYRCTRDPQMWAAELCPLCRDSNRWPLWIHEDEDTRRVTLACAGGCDAVDVLSVLVGAEAIA